MSKSNNQHHNYVKYSSLAIQMGLIIFGGAFGGVKLDEFFEFKFPYLTLTLTILSVVIAVYIAIKDLLKQDKK